jgi:hypothetical protein
MNWIKLTKRKQSTYDKLQLTKQNTPRQQKLRLILHFSLCFCVSLVVFFVFFVDGYLRRKVLSVTKWGLETGPF